MHPIADRKLIEAAVALIDDLAEHELDEPREADVIGLGIGLGLGNDGLIETEGDLGIHGDADLYTTKIYHSYVK